MIFRFKSVILRLFFIASSILIFSSADAARIYFNDVFKGTGSNYAEQTNSISNIQFISGSGFTFTSTDPADVTFRLTGNNVAGTLSYINTQGVKQSIIGQVSRQDKNGNTTIGLYFYTTTNEAFLLVIPGVTSYTANSNVSTSSDPILSVMNAVLSAQNSQPKILVNDVSVSNTESFAVFTISLSSAANAIVTFSPTLMAVTASLNTDYTNSMQSFNGSTWVNITSTVSIAQGATSIQIRVPILNAGANLSRTFNLNTGSTSGGNILNSDGAFGVGTITPTPTITTTGTLKTFSSCSGAAITPQSFTVAGNNLSANVIVTAPTGFEISTASGGTYTSTLTLTPSSGTVASSSIFVRLINSSTTASSGVISVTSTGAVSISVTATVNTDNALMFDGVNDYVNLGDVLDVTTTTYAKEAWVYWKGSNVDFSEIFSKEGVQAFAITNTNKLHINFGDGTNWRGGLNSTNSVPLNKWTHVAVTRSSSGLVKLYINGIEDPSTITNAFLGSNSQLNSIGAKNVNSTMFGLFNGAIDEVRVWNTERSSSEISSNLNKELIGNESGLLAYYKFNQGVASGTNVITTLNDNSPNAFNGTLTNFSSTMSGSTSNFVAGFIPDITATGNATSLSAGSTLQLSNTLTGGVWSSSNTAISTVDANTGLVNGVAAGSVTISYTICGKVATYNLTVITPTITTTGTLKTFASCSGASITPQSFTVAGTNLSTNVIVTAPTGFEISTASGGTYTSTLTLTPSSGTVASSSIFVRLINSSTTASSGVISVTSMGAVSRTVAATVNTDNALNFDGVDDYVTLPNESSFDFTNQVTVEAWIKVATFDKAWQAIVTKGDDSWRLHRSSSTNFINFAYTNTSNGVDGVTSTIEVNDNKWHHVAGVYNGSSLSIYIDGALNQSVNVSTTIKNSNNPVIIGNNFDPVLSVNNRYFNGNIDEVRIWNVARTASQIQANYLSELAGNETGLVANYNFNQGIGGGDNQSISSLIDRSTNAINGTITNFTKTGSTSNFVAGFIPDITAAGNATTVLVGSTLQLSNVLTGGTWSTSNSSLATINATTGLTTGVAVGSVTMTYTVCTKTVSYNLTIITPTITTTGTLSTFNSCLGTASASQTFTVSAQFLTSNLVLTAPAGYELSTTAGGTYSSTLSIAPTSGTVSARLIYVRLSASAVNGQSGNIVITSTDAVTQNIATGNAAVTRSVAASVTISSGATNNAICSGSNIVFTATPTNGGNAPSYQWKLNNSNITGANSATYSTTSLTNNAAISVSMTSSLSSCVTGSPASSNTITTTVTSVPSTPGTISGLTTICLNSNQVYSVPSVSGATSYTWVVTGNIIATVSSTTNVINITAANTQGSGSLEVFANNACGTSVASSSLSITVNNTPAPTASFTVSPSTTVCLTSPSVTFSNTSTANAGSTLTAYNWDFGDGSLQATTDNASRTFTASGNFDVVMNVTSSNQCTSSISSRIIVDPISVAGTASVANNAICEGATTVLTLSGNTGAIQWQSSTDGNSFANIPGANSATYTTPNLTATTYYKAVVTSGSCTSANSGVITVTVNPTPSVTLASLTNINNLATSFNLSYSNIIGGADEYSITAVAPNAMPNFVAISNYGLPASPITVSIPASPAGTYNFNLVIKNGSLGCVSVAIPFTQTVFSAGSSVTVTGPTTFTFNGFAQGPNTNTKTGSTGAVTYSYAGTGSTTYTASATAPTNVGAYQVIATLAADANYSGASSAPYAFTITAASSTITVTGTTTYTFTGAAQGPATHDKTGSTGGVTYSYTGTGSTTYTASATAPTNVGTYQVIATLAADANYSGASSAPYAFTITAAGSTIVVTGATTYIYNGAPQGPATNTKTGSTGAVTYSYTGTGSTTYTASATAPTNAGTYQVIATLAADANFNGATSAPYAFIINDAPSVISINRVESTPTNLSTLRFLVTFSKDITGFDVGDLTIINTGTVSTTSMVVSSVTSSTYTVTVGGITGNGTLGLNLKSSGTSIIDSYGAGITNGIAGQVYTIDKITITPSFISPATSDNFVGTSLGISVNIPETNLPNTITLTFAGLSNTVIVTLNNGSGIIAGNLNLNNLLASSIVLSSSQSTLPSDIYSVTLSYQDYLGNPVASTAINNFKVNYNLASTIVVTGATTYTYNANPQGPATNTKTGSTGAVTYSYAGTGSTTYTASATAPTNVGTYQVIATLAANANYTGAVSAPYAFTITAAGSTIVVTGATTYTFNGAAQGPATNTKTGSTGAVTYSYAGTGSTTYGPIATLPTNAGTYTVVATLASDGAYNGAISNPYAFTINKLAPLMSFGNILKTIGDPNFTMNATSTSGGSITYSIVNANIATVLSNTVTLTGVGITTITVTQAETENYTAATTTASLTVNPAAPRTSAGTFIFGNPSNPSNTSGLISPNPGATLNFYSVATGGTPSSVQPLPSIVGVYTFYVSQTINGIEGLRVSYTVTILPSITVKSNTYIAGALNNPSNISSLVIGITNGSKPKWCNVSGLNCSDIAPALPSTPGVYIWCVKAVDIASGLESSGCVYDTVTILAPTTVMAVQKKASTLTLQPDGTYTMDFTFTLTNNLSVALDSIQLIDNLSAVFTSPSTYKVMGVTATGTLVASTIFNGSSVTNLLLPASKLGANKSETVVLKLQVLPQTYAGTLTNNATAYALSPYGTFGSPASTTFVIPAVNLYISDVVTPNQDGKNDQWIIVKPSNKQLKVEIVNRWGQRVFANPDYQNNFVGRGTGSFLGQDLAEGTYFYFIEMVDRVTGVKEFRKGYLTLKR